MERFIVFAYNRYYPRGGSSEVMDSFDKLEEAQGFVESDSKTFTAFDYYEILDTKKREWV